MSYAICNFQWSGVRRSAACCRCQRILIPNLLRFLCWPSSYLHASCINVHTLSTVLISKSLFHHHSMCILIWNCRPRSGATSNTHTQLSKGHRATLQKSIPMMRKNTLHIYYMSAICNVMYRLRACMCVWCVSVQQ